MCKPIRAFFVAAALVALCGGASLADSTSLPEGNVVLSKSSPDAVLLWDATSTLAKLVAAHSSQSQILATLESDAMQIAAHRAADLKQSKQLTVTVIYSKTGAVSPVYQTATFAGIERLLNVSAATGTIVKNGSELAQQLQSGTVPDAVTVKITGELPPAS